MEIIFLTTLFSVFFAALFLLLFFSVRKNRDSCADQDALIPFRDDEVFHSNSESQNPTNDHQK